MKNSSKTKNENDLKNVDDLKNEDDRPVTWWASLTHKYNMIQGNLPNPTDLPNITLPTKHNLT